MDLITKDNEIRKGIREDYPFIPMNDIDDEARIIAVRWGDEYFKGFALQEKQKLASDFVNYARRVQEKKNKIRGCTTGKNETQKTNFYKSLYQFLQSNLAKDHVFYNEQYEDLTNIEKTEFNNYIKTSIK